MPSTMARASRNDDRPRRIRLRGVVPAVRRVQGIQPVTRDRNADVEEVWRVAAHLIHAAAAADNDDEMTTATTMTMTTTTTTDKMPKCPQKAPARSIHQNVDRLCPSLFIYPRCFRSPEKAPK